MACRPTFLRRETEMADILARVRSRSFGAVTVFAAVRKKCPLSAYSIADAKANTILLNRMDCGKQSPGQGGK